MSELVTITDLVVRFGPTAPAVDGVSLSVAHGETVGLVGESGSGKTTIGRAVLGLVPVSGGSIRLDGIEIGATAAADRGELGRKLQTVFQDPNSSLNPARTVGRSIVEPMRAGGRLRGAESDRRAGVLLERVGLPAAAARRYPHEFSGGQRQRIAIARALAAQPELIVCDEPTSALDLSTQAQMLNLLADLRAAQGLAYLFVSHDLTVVRHIADRIVVLYRGRVMESGPAAAVTAAPLHPYTRAMQAAAPIADVVAQRERRAAHRTMIRTTPTAAPTPSIEACPFATRCVHAAEACWSHRPHEIVVGLSRVACHMYDPASGHPGAAMTTAAAPVPAARPAEGNA